MNKVRDFVLSNIAYYKGSKDNILLSLMKKRNIYKSNCIDCYNNSLEIIKEVLATNDRIIKKHQTGYKPLLFATTIRNPGRSKIF
jgi:hypothetical protein